MRIQLRLCIVWLLLCPAASLGNQYYVGYEGDTLPEEQPGWERVYGHGGAERSIQTDETGNSFLVIDSLSGPLIYDFAEYERPISPGPGERFFAEWRVLILEPHDDRDQGVAIAADDGAILAFEYGYDRVLVAGDVQRFLDFEGGLFHTYRFESDDMRHYTVSSDEVPFDSGRMFDGLLGPYVAFGDAMAGPGGQGSLAIWDYMRFGVTPEPGALLGAIFVGFCACDGRRRW
jgi:hypothetical protein